MVILTLQLQTVHQALMTIMYKINFNGKLVLPEYSAGLFTLYNDEPSTGKYISEIDLTNVDMKNVVNATSIFNDCLGLTSIDLSNFTGESLTNAEGLKNLTSIGWNATFESLTIAEG